MSDFYSNWAYFGGLTLLLEIILFLSWRLILIEIDRRNEIAMQARAQKDPILRKILKVRDAIDNSVMGEIPNIAYLVYPKGSVISTENSAVYLTLNRAKEVSDPEDTILQVLSFPPTMDELAELEYTRDQRFQQTMRLLLEMENDESSSEHD